MKKILVLLTIVVVGGIFVIKTSLNSFNKQVTIVGSTALQPIVEVAAEDYQATHQGVSITVQGGGSGTGLSQVQAGAVTVGNSDIFAVQQQGIDASKLKDHQVAVVGIAPIVNKKAKVNNLSMEQLRGIFTGKYINWKQLGGADLPIIVINRASGSGTRATFEQSVMKGEKPIKTQEQDSSGTVTKMITSTPGSISYVAFSYLKGGILALKIDGVSPIDENVTTDSWKIWSYEHMYTKGNPDEKTQAFINYMHSDIIQKKLIKSLGYIPISDMKVQKSQENVVTPR